MSTKVINFFGGPGSSKSTTAAGLFYLLKLNKIRAELTGEYAKDMVWREFPPKAFSDQLYITAKQNHRLLRLVGKVDYIINDSPLLWGSIYRAENYYKTYDKFLFEVFDSYPNINFFITRQKDYDTVGRNQSEEESDRISLKIKEMLDKNGIEYHTVNGDSFAANTIFQLIKYGK